ncbi:MAG: hypothetical protein ACMG6S_01350 [Byssovorax sp.]
MWIGTPDLFGSRASFGLRGAQPCGDMVREHRADPEAVSQLPARKKN